MATDLQEICGVSPLHRPFYHVQTYISPSLGALRHLLVILYNCVGHVHHVLVYTYICRMRECFIRRPLKTFLRIGRTHTSRAVTCPLLAGSDPGKRSLFLWHARTRTNNDVTITSPLF